MKEVFEKIIERFEGIDCDDKWCGDCCHCYREETIRKAIKIVKEVAEDTEMGKISDGYHTFDELYHHRAVLFSVICNSQKDLAWKSKLHDTGDMYDGMFVVGIETPEGQATYHYDIEPYWDMFKVKELKYAPKWDGHTPEESIRRIGLLGSDINVGSNDGWIPCSENTPKIAGWYLAHVQHERKDFITIEKVLCKQIKNGRWRWYRIGNGCEVVAWMPLPEPYNPNICGNTDCPHNNGNYCPAWNGCGGYQSKEEENT